MKIKSIGCEQFAGVVDRAYEFSEGLNLVIGDNETGKSTLVDLLYSLMFQEPKINRKTDKDFIAKYFPCAANGVSGDCIDGKIKIDTADGIYVLRKDWSADGRAKLTLPDGTVISELERIEKILGDILIYRKGIYDELVFPSQRRVSSLLNGLMGESNGNVETIASTITKSVMETGGVDIDGIQKELDEKISAYEKRWDFEKNLPEGGTMRGITNKWKSGTGSILEAYYEKEDLIQKRFDAIKAEEQVDRINRQIDSRKMKKDEVSSTIQRFSQYRTIIESRNAIQDLIQAKKEELGKMKEVSGKWPTDERNFKLATKLKGELQNSMKKARFEEASVDIQSRDELNGQMNGLLQVSEEDLILAKKYEQSLMKLESQLSGMDVHVDIKQFGNTEVSVVSSVTGEEIDCSGGGIDLKESVEVIIPGVASIQLSPNGVDVVGIKSEIESNRVGLSELFKNYNVTDLAQLEDRKKQFDECSRKLKIVNDKIDSYKIDDWSQFEAEARSISDDTRTVDVINAEICRLCKRGTLDEYIGGLSANLKSYKDEYDSSDLLNTKIEEYQNTIGKKEDELNKFDDVPEEFSDVKAPEDYIANLQKQYNHYDDIIEELREKLLGAERELGDKTAEDYDALIKDAEDKFARLKDEHHKWVMIREAFRRVKDSEGSNPFEDVRAKFSDNLSLLSSDRIVLDSIDEKLDSSLSSGKNKLTKFNLSEGTKDTISLAFRIALLEYLFPEGGCVAVFDDPFTDMDPTRTKQACKLVQKFAEKNQVIFITCDNKYKTLLNGNEISMVP